MKDRVPQNTGNLWAVCVETGKIPGSQVQLHHLTVGYSVLSFRPYICGYGDSLRATERALDITLSAARTDLCQGMLNARRNKHEWHLWSILQLGCSLQVS